MAGSDAPSPHRYHILVALSDADRHGADIVRDVLAQTDEALRLWPATLYRLLEELQGEGLITELTGSERPEGVSARRRYYRITPAGRDAVAAQAAHFSAMAELAHRRLRRA